MKRKNIVHIVCALLFTALLICALAACHPTNNPAQKPGVSLYFISNGGTRVETITARAGADISNLLPADPEKEGYFFLGWYLTNKAATDHTTDPETLPTVMPSKSATYYAGWTDVSAEVVLDPKGGALEKTRITAGVGARLSELLRQYVPKVEDGIEFVGWYVGGELITAAQKLGEQGISLEARYKTDYVVNVYREGLDGVDALDETESVRESVFVGTTRTYTYKQFDGYERTSDLENASKTITVGMHPADNVIEVRYARLRVTVYYLRGEEGAVGEEKSFKMNFGGEFTLEQNPFTYERHRFAGWKIGDKIFKEGDSLLEEDMTVTDGVRIDIIAVWDEKFVDRDGGVDILWVLGGSKGDVELVREELPVIKGTLSSERDFSVTPSGGTALWGRLYKEDGLFSWNLNFNSHIPRYIVDDSGQGEEDRNDYADLADPDSSALHIGGEVIKGGYVFSNANGVYVFTSDEETSRTFFFSIVQINGSQYFVLREDFEEIYFCEAEDGYFEFKFHSNGRFDLFKGVELPYWLFKERVGSGTFSKSGDIYTLAVSGSEFDGKKAKVQPYGRTLVLYRSDLDKTFSVEGGGTLALDGYSGAVYTHPQGGETETENGEFYVVDGDVVFFGALRSQHFALKGGSTVAIKGDPEIYRAYVGSDGAESVVINGHGKLRYVNRRGRVFYANYVETEFFGSQILVKFSIDTEKLCYLLDDGIATKTGNEAGVFRADGNTLYIDGRGGAVFETGGQTYACKYELRREAPYDYQLSGEQSFRFILLDGAFRVFDETKYGDFVNKFGDQNTLFLDGYGNAELTEDEQILSYTLSQTSGIDVELSSADHGTLKVRLRRNASGVGGVFIKYDPSFDVDVFRYNTSQYDEEGDNLDKASVLSLDGYDAFTLTRDGAARTGVIERVDGIEYFAKYDDGGEFRFKLFEYELALSAPKLAYGEYDASQDETITNADGGAIDMDGYGIFVYSPAESEPTEGFYSFLGSVIVARGGGFEKPVYFNRMSNGFRLSEDIIIDGGVVRRYLGEGGDISLPTDVTAIGEGAFRNTAVRRVVANSRLDGGIAASAFENCKQLESISVIHTEFIGDKAFFGCEKLTTFDGSNSARSVGEQAFVGCAALKYINLSGATAIGKEAFYGVGARVAVKNLQNLGDRAFAHSAEQAPIFEMAWISKDTPLPAYEGEPFAFEGEGEDSFVIYVDSYDLLIAIYQNEAWSKYAGYLAFENARYLGEFFRITTLEKVRVDKISSFDGKKWTQYVSAEASTSLVYYNPNLPEKAERYDVSLNEAEGTLELTSSGSRIVMVKAGTSLTYSLGREHTLSFVMSGGETLQARFDSRQVTLSRDSLSFEIGNYIYTVTLFDDRTFTYSETYRQQSVGTYSAASDPDSKITLYKADESGTQFDLKGNYIMLGNKRVDLENATATSSSGSVSSGNYSFYLYDMQSEELFAYLINIKTDDVSQTYTADITLTYKGTRYAMMSGSSALNGTLVAYKEYNVDTGTTKPNVSLVYLDITYDSESYVIATRCSNNKFTISGDYPEYLKDTYVVEFDDEYGLVIVVRDSQ